jgi:beta-lactamase regulating signal transducer with metallopeptidase domain
MSEFVLDHLWQSTLFAGAAGLLTLALRRDSARIRYGLWFAASAKFLIPFAAFAAFGTWLSGLSEKHIAVVPVLSGLQPLADPFSNSALIAAPAPDRLPIATMLVLALWLIGFLVLAGRWLIRWRRLQRILRDATLCAIAAPVPVKMAASLLEPGLVGIWRPVILLPQGIAERLSPTELDAVLAHEICHLRRRDNLLAAIHMLVEALFWFHPLVWWLGARLNEERERACDEHVLASGQSPDIYAESILKVCHFYLQSPLDCAAGISGADLKTRMETIMENKLSLRLNAAKKTMLAGAATIAIAGPVVAGLVVSPAVLAQPTNAS